jgi:hypothetical protein
LKPTAGFDFLVNPITARVEHVRDATKDVGGARKERAEIASAVKEIRSSPDIVNHLRHRQDVLDGAEASPGIGSMLPANAAPGRSLTNPMQDALVYLLGFQRENRAFPSHGLETLAHCEHLTLAQRR